MTLIQSTAGISSRSFSTKTADDYKAMIEKQFPGCIGIYVDSNYSSIFYVFIQNKE